MDRRRARRPHSSSRFEYVSDPSLSGSQWPLAETTNIEKVTRILKSIGDELTKPVSKTKKLPFMVSSRRCLNFFQNPLHQNNFYAKPSQFE